MEVSKSDAIDFAASIRKMVDALVEEGFDEETALKIIESALKGREN